MKKIVLVVVAHPDDEVLGVGGSLVNHVKDGDDVYVVFMTNGEDSRDNVNNDKITIRNEGAHNASKIIGVNQIFFEDFPDNKMDSVAILDVIKVVENYIDNLNPSIIYTHHNSDINIDHRVVFEAVITASRPIRGNKYPKEIYCFETLSSTEWGAHRNFAPNIYKNIEDVFDIKIRALECYKNEMRAFPHPRSYEVVESLAKLRGSEVALKYAEAFMCIRNIKG